MQGTSVISPSPSLNSYSSSRLAEIALRVVEELRLEDQFEHEHDFVFSSHQQEQEQEREREGEGEGEGEGEVSVRNDAEEDEDDDEEEEFEFAVVSGESNFSPIPADEIFYNGQIRPVYPVFGRNLIPLPEPHESKKLAGESPPVVVRRLPLLKLFNEEKELASSCSSSEADDLEGIPAGTYCVWRPKPPETSSERCKKSSSTGTSKRWRFALDLNLLNRSNSEGTSKDKDTYVFLTPTRKKNKKKSKEEVAVKGELEGGVGGDGKSEEREGGGTAVEARWKNKKKPLLPYRADLVGFFSNVNGLSKNLHPF